ncbi:hypothetical protein CFO_g47 [Ceratocystis platani]|uniref:GPN-loop GTPase 2 n=1 Tax=Ceratocystis fimbriata f. sp. platani TaxID=88771 RepID=A0A0F8DPC3_CERFI|nr:hypothetical protein CFO_g47 [Ceratocystis platani]
MPFGQLVIVFQFLGAIGRSCSVVNLDPANENTNYPRAIDIRDLVKLEEIMKDDKLGPNGAMLYALEELEHNFDWLEESLNALDQDYVLFDCPGQVELYTHHNSLRNIILKLQALGYRMDMPHINVLTKIDKVSSYDPLPLNLDYYTDVDDLSYLTPHLENESPIMGNGRFARLNEAVANLIQNYSLVRYEVLAVENKKSMMHLLRVIDRAGGYVFGGAEGANDTVWQVAMRNESSMGDDVDIQERWIDSKEEWDKMEQEQWEDQQRIAEKMAVAEGGLDTDMTDPNMTDPDFGDMKLPSNIGVKVVRKT